MKKSHLFGALCAGVFSLITTISNAALTPKLCGQVVYDDDLDLTWVANTNLAASNTFGLATGVSLGTYPGDLSGDYK